MDIAKKSEADHRRDDFAIYSMVLNRLPIVADNEINKELISNFILEVMIKLEVCLTKGEANVGIEKNYSLIEQSMIADVTAMQILMISALESTGGNATQGTGAANTFLERAKAGSVEVEYGELSLKDSVTLTTSTAAMFSFFKTNAINKAAQLGCSIDITDDVSVSVTIDNHIPKPFIIVESGTN